MQNAKAQTPDMRIAPSAQHDWDAILVELCEQGFVRIPAFLSPEKCAAVQKGILDAFKDAPFGRDERTNARRDADRVVGLGTDVDILPLYQIDNDAVRSTPMDDGLHELLSRQLGDDYYMDRSIARRARGNSDRFYYHKDLHGDIGLTILLNDLDVNEGATTMLPKRHLGTPPTVYCMNDINGAAPQEVQLTGKAGDAVLFYRDIDHSRSENLSGRDNIQLIFTFVNKNTFPWAHSRQELGPEILKSLPARLAHMLRPYDGRSRDTQRTFVEKIIYGSGFSSPGAGEYDIRNDLFRDFLYTMFLAKGKPMTDTANGAMPRYTTRLNMTRRIGFFEYVGHLKWRRVMRAAILGTIRKIPFGATLLQRLRGTPA